MSYLTRLQAGQPIHRTVDREDKFSRKLASSVLISSVQRPVGQGVKRLKANLQATQTRIRLKVHLAKAGERHQAANG